jgi:hypothetical protein
LIRGVNDQALPGVLALVYHFRGDGP